MAEDVRVIVIGSNSKVQGVGTVPLVLDGFDKQDLIAEPELNRAFASFVAAITFNSNFHGIHAKQFSWLRSALVRR